jgi:hypothetical protein
MVIVDVSPIGISSCGSGTQVPVSKLLNFSIPPLKTLRSSLEPGTPYFGAIPHDVYCQTVQFAEHSAVVHEWTKQPLVFTFGLAPGLAGSIVYCAIQSGYFDNSLSRLSAVSRK